MQEIDEANEPKSQRLDRLEIEHNALGLLVDSVSQFRLDDNWTAVAEVTPEPFVAVQGLLRLHKPAGWFQACEGHQHTAEELANGTAEVLPTNEGDVLSCRENITSITCDECDAQEWPCTTVQIIRTAMTNSEGVTPDDNDD